MDTVVQDYIANYYAINNIEVKKVESKPFERPLTNTPELNKRILTNLQQSFLKRGNLMLFNYVHDTSIALPDFYIQLYTLTTKYVTVNEDERLHNADDEDYTPPNKKRSLTDLYRICHHYRRYH